MIIGVPKEIKTNENRIALIPAGVEILKQNGHQILVENNGGVGSGFTNEDYVNAGAEIVDSAEDVFSRADMIMKVKEPLPQEYKLIRKRQIVFTYFHFAASRELTEAMMASQALCIAYETIETPKGSLPLLLPMSEVAGRMAIQEGAKYLEKYFGGRGILLGGIPGVQPASVVILGGGVVGTNAAKIAAGMGARVTIMDVSLERLRYLDDVMPKNVITEQCSPYTIRQAIQGADLVVGAVLIAGAKAPRLVTREMLKLMKPGSVIVDVAVDQGGCVETIKPTTHEHPTYVIESVIHYGVANMPGAVPMTSTKGLTNDTLPYAVEIANNARLPRKEFLQTLLQKTEIAKGINIIDGKITCKGVSDAFDLPYHALDAVVALAH